jgi:hypothetical protein
MSVIMFGLVRRWWERYPVWKTCLLDRVIL